MPAVEPVAAMAAKLSSSTGKSLDQWIDTATRSEKERHGGLVAWLKSEHQLTHGYANLAAHATFKSDAAVHGTARSR